METFSMVVSYLVSFFLFQGRSYIGLVLFSGANQYFGLVSQPGFLENEGLK